MVFTRRPVRCTRSVVNGPATKSGGCDTSARMTVEAIFEQIRALSARVRSAHIRALLLGFLAHPALAPAFMRAPAAKSIHHAHAGGLCKHTLPASQLAWRICAPYPRLHRDLV